MSAVDITLGEVAAALVLVALAVGGLALARRRPRAGPRRSRCCARSSSSPRSATSSRRSSTPTACWLVALLLAVMVGVGTVHRPPPGAGRAGCARADRARALAWPPPPRSASCWRSGVFDAEAALPRAGRRDGDRQRHDRRGGGAQPPGRRGARLERSSIEATLALGATARQAARRLVTAQPALGDDPADRPDEDDGRSSPSRGSMVGMLVAGAEPVDAVRLQLILLWVLLGARRAVGADRHRARATAASSPRAHQLRE